MFELVAFGFYAIDDRFTGEFLGLVGRQFESVDYLFFALKIGGVFSHISAAVHMQYVLV